MLMHGSADGLSGASSARALSASESLQALAAEATQGNEQAFEELHRRLGRALHRFFLQRVSGQKDLADELSQQTWVEIWKALHEARYDSSRALFSTFAYAIGYKLWIQYLRKSQIDRGRLHHVGWDAGVIDGVGSDDANAACEIEDLLEALRRCQSDLRVAGKLTDVENAIVDGAARGVSERVLAQELGLAPSTINTRKQSAYDKLRRCLTNKGFEDVFAEHHKSGDE
jgi:RNA polymerase sigma factor (sigma-70 family)